MGWRKKFLWEQKSGNKNPFGNKSPWEQKFSREHMSFVLGEQSGKKSLWNEIPKVHFCDFSIFSLKFIKKAVKQTKKKAVKF